MVYFDLAAVRNQKSLMHEELSALERIASALRVQRSLLRAAGCDDSFVRRQLVKVQKQQEYVRTRLRFFDKVEDTVRKLKKDTADNLQEAGAILKKTDQG